MSLAGLGAADVETGCEARLGAAEAAAAPSLPNTLWAPLWIPSPMPCPTQRAPSESLPPHLPTQPKGNPGRWVSTVVAALSPKTHTRRSAEDLPRGEPRRNCVSAPPSGDILAVATFKIVARIMST